MKTLVLTGGTGDLGSVVIPRLLRDYRCAVLYHSRKPPDDVIPLADVSAIPSVAPVYGLVLLAGGFGAGATPDDFNKMFEMNLQSNIRAIDAALPHLENGGRIVAISSAVSKTRPPGLAAYSASKAALNAVVETMAKDLKKRDITVNALLPATIDTNPKRDVVAETIALLLSAQAAGITGQLIALTV
jgi:NAD(P)-dependent dehydrogenase (short-subunit alcohol dehydrogenase family)